VDHLVAVDQVEPLVAILVETQVLEQDSQVLVEAVDQVVK
jgi:uncharacterized RmlC-like cupin family protein